MTPISWCDLALPVPCLVEALGEEVLSNNAGLREAVHPVLHFTENVAICIRFVTESVFIDDVLGEQFQFHSEVLVPVHGSHEVEVLDVDGHELHIGGGDDAVEHEFDGKEVCSWCPTVVRVVDYVPAHHNMHAVWIFLLRAVDTDDLSVGDVLVSCLGYLLLFHECNSLGGSC